MKIILDKAFKGNKYTIHSEDPLNLQEKKVLWASTISGSQVKKLRENPLEFYNEKVHKIAPIFSAAQLRAMQFGVEMESKIVEQMNDPGILIDKRTYRSLTNPWLSANVDGFLTNLQGQKIGIFEAKCTTMEDIDLLATYYQDQLQFYMWFFGVKKVKLGVFSRTTLTYGHKIVEYDAAYANKMLDDIEEMLNAIATKTPPMLKLDPVKRVDVQDHQELQAAFKNYLQLDTQLRELAKTTLEVKKAQKKYLKQMLTSSSEPIGEFYDSKSLSKVHHIMFPKKKIDWELFKKDMEIIYNNGEVFKDFKDKYTSCKFVEYWKVQKVKEQKE